MPHSTEAVNLNMIGPRQRIISIDAIRGLVMLIMLMDHMRETVYLHMQLGDPVDVTSTSPLLVIMRLLSSFCAPAFVLLAGVSAYLYQVKSSKKDTTLFLATRGIFLIGLELLIIGFAWTGVFPPEKFYLQIIWCIGVSMLALAVLIHLPKKLLLPLAILLIAGHNLLDEIKLTADHALHLPWAILHQRDWIEIFGIPARTSYPVLPWIGVIALGYGMASYIAALSVEKQKKIILSVSISVLAGFFILRGLNVYGDSPWKLHSNLLDTVLGFFALTKYPASLLFLTFTLPFVGFTFILFNKFREIRLTKSLAQFGSGAMFFYIVHLYFLKLIYIILVSQFGLNQGNYYGVSHPIWVIAWTIAVFPPLYWITVKFVYFKGNNKHLKFLSYI